MTKTIEESVYDFANRQFHKTPINTMRDLMCVCSDFANEVLAQPLASRMTKEEKDKINRLYVDVNDKLQTCLNAKSYNQISELDNEYKKGLNMGMIIALKHIFGADFFKEGE